MKVTLSLLKLYIPWVSTFICGLATFSSDLAPSGGYDHLVSADAPVMYLKMGHPGTGIEKDYSSHGLQGKYHGGKPGVTKMPNGDKATVFNGLNEYLEVKDSELLSVPTSGVLTIEAWMRPDVLEFPKQEKKSYVHWMGKGTSGQREYVARMYSLTNPENRPNRISGYAFNLTGDLGAGSYFQDPVTAGEWIHYVLIINTLITSTTYPTGYTKIYKNGQVRDQDSLADYGIIPQHGTAPYRVGTRDLASFFKGAIGKVAVYDYELSPEKIMAHYESMHK